MRRMYSESELRDFIRNHGGDVVASLVGKDISVDGITSKGIANTGELANIGDVAITGDFSAGGSITGGEIIENMSGYTFAPSVISGWEINFDYAGVVKNGNKLTLAIALNVTRATDSVTYGQICSFGLPQSIMDKLFPSGVDNLVLAVLTPWFYYDADGRGSTIRTKVRKISANNSVDFYLLGASGLTAETKFYSRIEITFLLSENLASQE